MAKMQEEAALLRIAMLAAQADGAQSHQEIDRASRLLGDRLAAFSPKVVQGFVRDAAADVADRPTADVLAEAVANISASGRQLALEVATQVVLSDNRIEAREGPRLAEIGRALGFTPAQVAQVRQRHWPLKPTKTPAS
jgi:tellurite resistance protein